MREIKFRTWDKVNGCWASINSIVLCDDGSIAYLLPEEDDMPPYLEDEVELMQYTGLKDVNGKPIYEGDVVNVTWSRDDTEGENYAIAYDPNNDGYSAFDFVDWYEDINGLSCAYIDGQITVIGNKFENPELLEAD